MQAGALALAGLLPLSALAGTVYRCQGPNGQIAFTNHIGAYKHCRSVAHYANEAVRISPREAHKAAGRVNYTSSPGASQSESSSVMAESPKPASGDRILRGAVYKVVRRGGITEYTNIRPSGGAYHVLFSYISNCYACDVHSRINWKTTPLNLNAYRGEIASAATEYGLDPALLRAVIHAESAFNPNAMSDKGAQGLMQLMPGTASDLGVSNPFDAGQNIRGGAAYLAQLLQQFGGDVKQATAAYNAGPQNVQKYHGVPPFAETQVYVKRVATLKKRYEKAEHTAVATALADDAPRS